jgi:hypothetical protein
MAAGDVGQVNFFHVLDLKDVSRIFTKHRRPSQPSQSNAVWQTNRIVPIDVTTRLQPMFEVLAMLMSRASG